MSTASPLSEKELMIREVQGLVPEPDSSLLTALDRGVNRLGTRGMWDIIEEVKYRARKGDIKKNVAGYLKKTINNGIRAIGDAEQDAPKGKSFVAQNLPELFQEFQSQNPLLFETMAAGSDGALVESGEQGLYPLKDKVLWPTYIGQEFFTISSDKRKSDRVYIRLNTMDGGSVVVPLIRGRIDNKPQSKEYGILTVFHAKLLIILMDLWREQGRLFMYGAKDRSRLGYCYFTVWEIIDRLGWQHSTNAVELVKNALNDLSVNPYYIDWRNAVCKGTTQVSFDKSRSFTLILRPSWIDSIRNGTEDTRGKILFSDVLSSMLLNMRVITRSTDLLGMKSDIAFKLRIYAEPRMMSNNGYFHSTLTNLIETLQLPEASWHKKKSHRFKMFTEIVKDVDGKKTGRTNETIKAYIEDPGADKDHVLIMKSANRFEVPRQTNYGLEKKSRRVETAAPAEELPISVESSRQKKTDPAAQENEAALTMLGLSLEKGPDLRKPTAEEKRELLDAVARHPKLSVAQKKYVRFVVGMVWVGLK